MELIKNLFMKALEWAGVYTPDVVKDDLGAMEGERSEEAKVFTRESLRYQAEVEAQLKKGGA